MHRFIKFAFAAMLTIAAQAQAQEGVGPDLTPQQLTTACTVCKASAACNTPRLAGSVNDVTNWLNAPKEPTVLAWLKAAPSDVIESAPTYGTYDTLSQGKRDSWLVLLRNPRDFNRASVRNWVVDVWGAAIASSNAERVLLAGTFAAGNLQSALGGTARVSGTVSALGLAYQGRTPDSVADWLVNPANCQ
jgi:hypothetical protein